MADYTGGGFVMILKQYQNTRTYQDPDANLVYIHCQMNANIAPVTVRGIRLKRGQFLTSAERFGHECGMNESKMRRILNVLESDGLIVRETAGKVTDKATDKPTKSGTIITVVNYGISDVDVDQSDGQTDGQSDGETGGETDGQTDNSIINKNKEQRMKKEIEHKDTRNVNPDGLTPSVQSASAESDEIQQQINLIIRYMDELGFIYDDCQGKGGIRGLLGKYLRKEGREPGQIMNAVKLTVERDAAIYDSDNDIGYLIRCMGH